MGKSPAVNTHVAGLEIWALRGVWLVLPLVSGPVLAEALDEASRPVQLVTSAGLWGGWGLLFVAMLVPRTVTLTALRIAVPAACGGVVMAVVAADTSVGGEVAALVVGLVALGLAFAPSTGHAFVNGSSYGDEIRFPLRVPAPLLFGPLELVWVVAVAGAVAGPLLLAAERWIAGTVALVIGWALVWWGVRVLHNLARRWLVLVPAGLVLHDPLALSDPVLLRRADVTWLGPAAVDSEALDLTRGALGLALEVRMRSSAPFTVLTAGRAQPARTVEVDRLLFTPSRPGALLTAFRSRATAPPRR